MPTAYAYIRKSVVRPGKTTLSWEVQEAQVREMAARYGDADLTILSDWGISGRKGADGRPGYSALLDAIESGQCETIYAYSLSRLSRSLIDYANLAQLCQEKGIKIRLAKEGEQDYSSPSGRMIVGMLAIVAQMEAELAQERARDVITARRARGDSFGPGRFGAKDGEDLQAVIRAYEDAGSLHGAARLLTDRGVASRQGKFWRASSVRSVLIHGAPEVLPARPERGVSHGHRYLFARLLRCHCGQLLSPHSPRGVARYTCSHGSESANHGLPKSIGEAQVIDWVKAEVAGAGPADRDITIATDVTERRSGVTERLRRNRVMFEAGDLGDDEYRRTKKALDEELVRLDAEGRVLTIPEPDWDNDDPGLVNGYLRTLLDFVQMDGEMRPAYAVWLLPGWRRAS